jgi:uncharacterized membrane protein YdcZ (DUF606 family)
MLLTPNVSRRLWFSGLRGAAALAAEIVEARRVAVNHYRATNAVAQLGRAAISDRASALSNETPALRSPRGKC